MSGSGSLLESNSEGSVLASQSFNLSVQLSDLVLILKSDVSQLSFEFLVSGLESSDISSGIGCHKRSEVSWDVVSESGKFFRSLGEFNSQEFNGSGLILKLDVGVGFSDLNELVSQSIDGVLRFSQERLESN